MSIGERLKKVRTSKRMTQEALGDLCGIAGPTIRKYESGRLNPKIETLQKLAAALDCPVGDLFTFGDPPAPASVFDDWLSSIGYDVKIHDVEEEYGGGQALSIRNRETWDGCRLSFSEFNVIRDKVIAFTKFQISELFNAQKSSQAGSDTCAPQK